MSKIDKGFGKRLRKARKAAGLSLAKLGKRTGINPVQIWQYETAVHAPREATAEKLVAFIKRGEEREKVEHPPNCRCVFHAVPKKRGRPRKVTEDKKSEFEKSRPVDRKKVRAIMKRLADPSDPFPGTPLLLGYVKAAKPQEIKQAKFSKTPARLGIVERAWIEQQIDSHVHSRGWMCVDGPFRLVVMNKRDVAELCRIMLQVGGVQVRGE